MIVYEVNITVKTEVIDDYLKWLVPHIKELLAFDGFKSADFCQELRTQDTANTEIVVRYQVESIDKLDDYLEHHAPRLRQQGLDAFAGKVQFKRRILEIQDSFAG